MRQTISNKQVLTLFLSLATPVIVGGCAAVPVEPEIPVTAQAESPASKRVAVAAPAVPIAVPPVAVTAPSVAAAILPPPKNPEPTVYADTGAVAEDAPAVVADAADGETVAEDPPAADLPEENLWVRIRAGLRIPKIDSALTAPHERWVVENVEFREAMLERSKLYLYYIVEEVEKRGMPMEIALLPAIESAYKPYAYSRAKASGLWQFIPSTGRLYGLKTNWWYDGRRDIIASTRAALDYLQKLHGDFGDWQLALAAYNAGEGRIARAMESNRRRGLPTDYLHLKQLKLETRHYVPKLMAMVNIVSDPQRYGITLPDIPNEPYFTTVETDSQVDLGVIARLTGMDVQELRYINPGYTRWATDPNGPHHVLVPADKKDAVMAGLSTLPEHERVQWLHHEVRRGETLSSIARRYNLTVAAIRSSNKLGRVLRVGEDLLLPISAMAHAAPKAAPGAARPVRAAAAANRPIIHRVRRGDTLTSIARRYNVLVRQIAEWNTMDVNEILRLGRRLKIWTSDGPQANVGTPDSRVYA